MLAIKRSVCAAALTLAVPLAACSGDADDAGAASEISNETLATAMAQSADSEAMSEALQDTGLAQIFDGSAAYTVLMPSDAALERLGEDDVLGDDEARAVLAAVLREHVLPGALTPDDIRGAIAAQDGAVSIQTMGDGVVRFTMDGEQLTVTDENGERAIVSDRPIRASNGVAIPIDAVLKRP